MTLILAAMNQAFVVQVSDRRLTSRRTVVDEEYEKCFSLTLPGFRFSVAFTGLARVGNHSTKIWLMEKLIDFPIIPLSHVERGSPDVRQSG